MKKVFQTLRQFTSMLLVFCLLATAFLGTELYYNTGEKAYAAEFVGASNGTSGDQTIKGAQNMGTIDNSAATTYWFAGNAFYGMVRNGVEFGEDYDTSDWLLVDTDAMWGGEYLFSTWGNAYRADGSDLYTSSEDANDAGVADVNKVYYQKILTYGERLWSNYGSTWFTGQEASAVGTATVTTTNNSYRTFEDYISGKAGSSSYNYWIGASTADSIANGYTITNVKKWYETGSTDTTKYLTLNEAQAATVYENSTTNYINSSNYNGITEDMLGVQSSNIYSIIGAHLYAPSVGELEANETVYKKIVKNVYADYTAETNETGNWGPNGGWFSASTTTATANPAGHLYDRTRTGLWSRSFSGLRVGDSGFGAWCVGVGGNLYSGNNLAGSHAVAPAFNLDTSSVIMARSAVASTTPSSELASYNPNNLGSNVEFTLESNALSLTTDIAGKQLNNVVAGQTYDIAYTGASLTGEAHNSSASETFYVSAAIYDENDVMQYYGKLAAVSNTGAGTVSVTIPSTLEAGKQYKLALFEEQVIGTYNVTTPSGNRITTYTTDYVSPMNVATFTLDSLSAKANDGASLMEETTYSVSDIAKLITVTSASQGTLTFGTDYTIKSVTGNATVDGANITTGDNGSKNAKELVFEVSYIDESMNVVPTTTVTLTVNSSSTVSDDTYQGDQEKETDENGFYTWKDEVSGITWKYKTNDVGNVTYLYTSDDPSPLIDAAGTLNIPSRIADLTVIGIGGGSEDTPVVSMGDGDWVNLSLPETVTTINDYAFVKAQQQNANIIIPSTVTKIGAKAFYKSTIASVKINGMTGSVGYLAFGNCSNLSNVIIKGNGLTLTEESFSCSGVVNLTISGTVTIQKNAFNEAIGITSLYLPNGVTLEPYAFNACSGIVTLESNMSTLANNTFPGCTSITTLILDDDVESVEYDWNGHTSTVDRTVYIKNGNIKFQFYGNEGTYYSAYGTSGNVRVVYDEGTDEGTDLTATNNILTAITKTLASHTNKYQDYYKGQSSSVTYVYDGAKTTEQIMAEDAASDVIEKTDVQTGIEVSFDGTLLTTQAIDKNKVNVTALFGNIEGLSYDPEHFYVIRTEEFNSLSRNNAVTEEAIANFEPLTAQDSDLQNGLSAAVVVFTTVSGDEENAVYTALENGGYFYATVSVRVEEYTDKDYVEETYGSYTDIVEEINGLNGSIATMEESMKAIITNINAALGTSFDVNADDLVGEYEKAVEALSDALSSSVAENEGNIAEIQALIASVNATYGSNIVLADNATTEEINTAITEALLVISNDQKAKNETITLLKTQYVEIAQMLSDYMSDTENMEADAVDGTTINDIKSAIAVALADLNAANDELAEIDQALDNLYEALSDAMISMPSIMDTDGESAADKINSITAMINTLTSNYEANNAYLRECIAEIDKAFGYGYYPKYSDKYVFYINNTDYAENGLPELLFYVKTEPRTYLVTEDMCTFTEYENQELAAQYFDSIDGVKYFYLEDTVNGWSPMQTNPLNDYKKAMASLLNGFNVYGENAEVLIQTVNTICGYTEGDENYISIPANASATEITTAMNSALTAVDTKLNELDAQNTVFATQYAEAAEALAEFLDKDYGDSVSSEEAAEIAAATRKAVAELAKIRSEMDDVNSALDNLYDALEKAFVDMGLGVEAAGDGGDTEDEESVAEKIESISGMIAMITDSYNRLSEDYSELSGDYQSILNYVYGEDEKLVGQVTPEQVQAQIEKNKQDAIDAAVEKALAEADEVNVNAEELQNEIASAIDAIMEGEDVSTDGMSQALVSALGQVEELKANVSSMQATVDGYESFLTTLKNALNLDDTATTADIIAAIQGMKDQIAVLSEKVNTLTTENATLSSENTELKAQIEAGAGNYDEGYAAGFAAGQASVDTDGTYQKGYAAGYVDGQASIDTSDNSETYKRGYNAGYAAGKAENTSDDEDDSVIYENGFNAGYAAGVASVDTSTTGPTYTAGYNAGYLKGFTDASSGSTATDEQLVKLTEQIQSLTTENAYLSAEVSTLQNNNAELASKVSSLTTANTSLTNKVNMLTNEKSTLSGQVSTLKSQVSTLTSQLEKALANAKSDDEEETVDVKDEEETETVQDDLNVESSTIEADKNSTLVSATTPKYDLGTVIETLLPNSQESNTVAKNQKATTELNELGNSRAALSTNAVSTKTTTDEQLNNAYLILAYYMNHLDELGDLGSEEIKEAARDEAKNVVFDVLTSVNVEASEEQLEAMAANKNVTLTLSSNDFKSGELYFVIHESTARSNTFDVLLVTAENGEISMELPDLSPITVTKISIKDTAPVIEDVEEDTQNGSFVVESVENETDDSNETFKLIMDAIIVIAFVLAIAIVLYLRKKKKRNVAK